MTTLRQLSGVSREDIQALVRRALRPGLDPDEVADFVASVDWTGSSPTPIARQLGELEAWAAAYAEEQMSRGEYMARLSSLLPEEERVKRLITGPGDILILIPTLPERRSGA